MLKSQTSRTRFDLTAKELKKANDLAVLNQSQYFSSNSFKDGHAKENIRPPTVKSASLSKRQCVLIRNARKPPQPLIAAAQQAEKPKVEVSPNSAVAPTPWSRNKKLLTQCKSSDQCRLNVPQTPSHSYGRVKEIAHKYSTPSSFLKRVSGNKTELSNEESSA